MAQCATDWVDQSCCPEDLLAAFIWQGSWETGRTYAVNAAVESGGSTWLCVKSHTSDATNEPPADALVNPTTEFWELMALGGEIIDWQGQWLAGTAYLLNQAVQDEGTSYIAIAASQGAKPTDNPGVWDIMAASGQGFIWRNDYDAGITYAIDEAVSFDTGTSVSSFVSLQDSNLNNTPVGGAGDLFWDFLAEGATGADGVQGIPGLNGLPYRLDADSQGTGNVPLDADGEIRFDVTPANITSITEVRVSYVFIGGADVSDWLRTFDDSTTLDNRGRLSFVTPDLQKLVILKITGAIINDSNGALTFPVEHTDSTGTFVNDDDMELNEVQTGDLGATGADGVDGVDGVNTPADQVAYTPDGGNIIPGTAVEVQAALDALDVLDAADVPNTPAGNIVATDVQAAINELDGAIAVTDAIADVNIVTKTVAGADTYAKPANLIGIIVELAAGGGGGGGGLNAGPIGGSSGSAGGYSRKWIPEADLSASETTTVGALGAAGVGAGNGGAGGTSSFGAHLSATGGGGGVHGAPAVAPGVGTGGDVNLQGGYGGNTNLIDGSLTSNGGASFFGSGGAGGGRTAGTGSAGTAPGSGGGGGIGGGGANFPGANGAIGLIIITEYLGA